MFHCPWCVTTIGLVLIIVDPFIMNIVVNLAILFTSRPFIYEGFIHECFGVFNVRNVGLPLLEVVNL